MFNTTVTFILCTTYMLFTMITMATMQKESANEKKEESLTAFSLDTRIPEIKNSDFA